MDKLGDVAIFLAVVQKGSFTAAARHLHTTVSSVSKKISQLEEQLGVQLLNRSTRRLVLTDAGELFHKACAHAVTEIETAAEAAQGFGGVVKGTLRVHASPGVGYELIRDMALEFALQNPQVKVDFHISGGRANLLENGFDVVVRSADLQDTSLQRREIAFVRYFVVASKDYLARCGTPTEPTELSNHTCLLNTGRHHPGEWVFTGPQGNYTVSVCGTFQSNNGAAILHAAVKGLGVACVPEYLLRNNPDTKRLEVLFSGTTATTRTIKAYYPRARHMPAKVNAFLDFLVSEAAKQTGCECASPKVVRRKKPRY